MKTDHKVMQQVLDALAQPVQEPVAYIHRQGNHWEVSERFLNDDEKARGWTEEPLYTAPPQPQRQPLTDEQIDAAVAAWFRNAIVAGRQPFAKRMRAAIEAAHGIGG